MKIETWNLKIGDLITIYQIDKEAHETTSVLVEIADGPWDDALDHMLIVRWIEKTTGEYGLAIYQEAQNVWVLSGRVYVTDEQGKLHENRNMALKN